jgi:uncharacterized membrane protein/uncharacterized protein (DUF2141 family)
MKRKLQFLWLWVFIPIIGFTQPNISVDVTSISETLAVDSSTTHLVTIENLGDQKLNWSMKLRTGDAVSFSKAAYVDNTLPENQDFISGFVALTRGEYEPLFNILYQTSYSSSVTTEEWCLGTTANSIESGTYDDLREASDYSMSSVPGQTFSLHLIDENRYFDVTFSEWGQDNGGSFAYSRIEVPSYVISDKYFGSVNASESSVMTLSFDATEQGEGVKSTSLILTSNDPDQPEIIIPIDLTVTDGTTKEISTYESTLSFDDTFLNYSQTKTLYILNTGDQPLTVSDVAVDDAVYVLSETSFVIDGKSYYAIDIDFTPTAAQAYPATLTITSDDPVTPSYIIDLDGTGIEIPDIFVDETPIVVNASVNERPEIAFDITNSGNGDLDWEVNFIIGDPVSFTREPNVDWTLPENQDRITDNVWITRQERMGPINAVDFEFYGTSQPNGTFWAPMPTIEADLLTDYGNWFGSHDWDAQSLPGATYSMYIPEANKYFDIHWLEWGSSGGSFSYERQEIAHWMSSDMTSNILAATSTDNLTFTVDTYGLEEGSYSANLVISSNDPDEGEVVIPISLTVAGTLLPDASTTTPSVSATLAIGETGTQTLSIINTGDADLEAYGFISMGEPVFFERGDYVSGELAENQDRISDNLWLTRPDDDDAMQNMNSDGISFALGFSNNPQSTYGSYDNLLNRLSDQTGFDEWQTGYALASDIYQKKYRSLSLQNTATGDFYDLQIHTWTAFLTTMGWDDYIYPNGFSYTRYNVPNWVDLSQNMDIIAAGEQTDVTVSFDATGLTGGVYNAMVYLQTNDEAKSVMEIPIELIVTGGTAEISAPDSLAFADTYINESEEGIITISNTGDGILNITDVTSGNAVFVPNVSLPIAINGGDSIHLPVTFTPDSEAFFSDSLTIISDDPVNSTLKIGLSGNGILPPAIDFSVLSFDENLVTGNTLERTLTITNTGDTDLEYTIDYLGKNITEFSKAPFGDVNLPENQDSLSPFVSITRGDNKGLYNITQEDVAVKWTSPINTEWTEMASIDAMPGDYESWDNMHGSNPSSVLGVVTSMHLTETNQYFDVTMTYWQSGGGGGFTYTRKEVPAAWLKASDRMGVVPAGASVDVTVLFDASDLAGDNYTANFVVTSSDPLNEEQLIPVSLTVFGNPEITVEPTSIDFGDMIEGYPASQVFEITNTGDSRLEIIDIVPENSDITVNKTTFALIPNESREVEVTLNPSIGTYATSITISSNDPDNSSLSIPVTAEVQGLPIIAVTPEMYDVTLNVGQTTSEVVSIANNGNDDLSWEAQILNISLEAQRISLNEDYQQIVDLIPNMYEFSYDGGNNYIDDGGGDMYDDGNFLNTNYNTNIVYSDDVIDNTSSAFGPEGAYFTQSYPGLFIMIADLDNIDYFKITGNLGADGSGSADATIIEMADLGYTAYVKRVFNGGDPSVNHVVIIPTTLGVEQAYSTNTDNDYHEITNLNGVNRIYYLLYAGDEDVDNGYYINDAETEAIVRKFLEVSVNVCPWASIAPESGSVSAAASFDGILNIDAGLASLGQNLATLVITSNDPENTKVNIPINLFVNGITVENPIADVVETAGFGTHDILLENVFVHSEGAPLSYSVSVNNEDVVTGAIIGDTLRLTEVGAGITSIIVEATDGLGGVAEDMFDFSNEGVISSNVPIADQLENNGFSSSVIDLTSVFSYSGGNPLGYSVSVDDPSVVSALVNGTNLEISEVGIGSTRIVVVCDDSPGTNTASDDFNFTVNSIPTVEATIADDLVNKGFNSYEVDITGLFADADDDELMITASSDDDDIAVAEISENMLILTEGSDFGTITVTIEASDYNSSVSTTFSLEVNPMPYVSNSVGNQVEIEGFVSTVIDISGVFADDDADIDSYDVDVDNTSIVTASLVGTDLTITEVALGNTDITLTATDIDGASVTDVFNFKVDKAANNAPTVVAPFDDEVVVEGFGTITYDLSTVFEDVDADPLTFTAYVSGTSVVKSINGNILTLTENGGGLSEVLVMADDNFGGVVTDEFTVYVNRNPVIDNPIADIVEPLGFGTATVDISAVFSDPDGDDLTYSVSQTGTSVTATIDGTTVTITEASAGVSVITVTAEDGLGGMVDEEFTFKVSTAPTVTSPIADMVEDAGFTSTTIDLDAVFDDADGDALTYSVSQTGTSVSTAVDANTLTITEVEPGQSVITVTADDGNGESVSDEFNFKVSTAPTVVNPLADMQEDEGFGSTTVDLTNVFDDADGDALTLSVAVTGESVSAAIDGTTLTITELALGTSTITVTADDGNGGTVSDDFDFIVEGIGIANGNSVDVNIYPNPASEYVIIEGNNLSSNILVKITDITGRTFISKKVNLDDSNKFEISSINEGVYLVTIYDGDKVYQKKLQVK